jgi:hypothetical protein
MSFKHATQPVRQLVFLGLMMLSLAVLISACGAQAAATAPAAPTTAPVQATQAPAATTVPADTAAPPADTAVPATSAATVSFANDILPILQSRCINCHGGQKTEKGLDLTTYDTLMMGSENGPVVVAGDSTNSMLAKLILAGKMPKRGPKLLPEQVQKLVDWIMAGAPNN